MSAPPPKPSGSTDAGSRIALRNWRISTRLVSLLALPVVAATSLGALRIDSSLDEIEQLDNMKILTEMTKHATKLATALQDERDQSAGPLVHGAKASDFEIKGLRENTDRTRQVFLEGTRDLESADQQALDGVRSNVRQITSQLYTLQDIRKEAYQDRNSVSQTVDSYSQLIEQLLDLSTDMAQATSNPEMIQRTRALAAFTSAKEYASIQRAVIAAGLPAGNSTYGKLSETDRRYGENAFDNEDGALAIFTGVYTGNAEELLKPASNSNPTISEANSYAKRVLTEPNGMRLLDKRSYRDWVDDASAELDAMQRIETTLLTQMEQKARELRNESESTALLNGALIFLVLGVSLVGAFVMARSMIRSLRRLQDTATKVAQERLPELVRQLSESDPQDVDASVESVGVHSKDEIGQVAAAFDDVHREAVRLAAEQALLRGNVNAMFTNLSRRSQGLIQRQLSLISELESREADPDQLSSLFKLDHLATRMRRNGENLLVLAGEEPGRRWTRPVPLVDVLRAAASEVEQYERIELSSVPATEVAGRVVNDLVHLLAELLENATSFSSPQTKVKVTGHALPDGRVLIEIHDTGIGLSPEDLSAINERLASPPTVDVSVSRRMGLFVVGRLSQRHGIRIQLRPSDSGGTTALVMLPVDVAQGGKKVPSKKGGPAAAQAASGVAAARRGGAPAPGLGAGPGPSVGGPGVVGSGNGGPSAPPQNRLGSAPARGQVTGSGPRAALPGRDPGATTRPEPTGSQGGSLFGGPPPGQGAPQGNQAGQGGADLFGQGGSGNQAGGLAAGPDANLFGQGRQGARDAGRQSGYGDDRNTPTGPANLGSVPAAPQQRGDGPARGEQRPQLPPGAGQLPPPGGPRAELPASPGSSPAPTNDNGPALTPRLPSWSDENARPQVSASLDVPRGHEEPDATAQFPRIEDRQGPGSTAEFQRPDFDAPRDAPQNTGQFTRQDAQGPAGFGQDPLGGGHQGRAPEPQGRRDPADFAVPRPPDRRPGSNIPQQPQPQIRPDQLPPVQGGGDGGTPLYDTLETNWFHGTQGGEQPAEPQAPLAQAPAAPAGPPRPATPPGGNWRTSPNDELGRQAERVRQPSAGGITTSGLPRRVPRANLVAGTAEQQQQHTGPQVSRAPDDVRGRLTNLRRGIQQGRHQTGQGGSARNADGSTTGGYPRPSHQQER